MLLPFPYQQPLCAFCQIPHALHPIFRQDFDPFLIDPDLAKPYRARFTR